MIDCHICLKPYKNARGLQTHHGRAHKGLVKLANLEEHQHSEHNDDNFDDDFQLNEKVNIFEPFCCKEELELAYWHAHENTTKSAKNRLKQIGIFNKDGTQIQYSSKKSNAKIDQIKDHHPQLDAGTFRTIDYGAQFYAHNASTSF